MSTLESSPAKTAKPKTKYRPTVGPRLKILLAIVFGLFAVLCVNSTYLVSVDVLEARTGQVYQNYFYQIMFLAHLALGLVIVVPFVIFGALHLRNARNRPNYRAKRMGYALFVTSIIVLVTGVMLMRLDIGGFRFDLKQPFTRSVTWWLHVLLPLAAIWLFILHRLAGRTIKWKVGVSWAAVAAVFALVMTVLHSQDPRKWNVAGPKEGEQYFFPSLARTSSGNFIPADTLMMNEYCMECHPDTHKQWSHSAHSFSSFNNPPYAFSVRETRRVAHERDGKVNAARWCAGCHDPVPFFSGEFEDPRFDDPHYDLASDPMASASISCTVCHAITHVNSTRGNADFTIEEPTHYPFAFSENPLLRWVNRQLVKANPEFHKKTFLKPLHKEPEFCSTCHKVHLPPELNDYKWIRGQNHYDTYHLSGVSGHGVQSWYYPPKATHNCNECHMPLIASNDFGAKPSQGDPETPLYDELTVHDHMWPSANTALPKLKGMADWVNQKHEEFMKGFIRVDLFALREGTDIETPVIEPLRPTVPTLEPGKRYLLDAVVRTVKIGHPFTQGTVDSNEVWLDVTLTCGDRVIGRSGGIDPQDGTVDPWSHFINVYMLDRDGNRIDRRNPQDIFTPLYNHQIPPGAGDVMHYAFTVPPDADGPVTAEIKLQYRKFDTAYMKLVDGEKFVRNDLPISTLASDRIVFPVKGLAEQVVNEDSKIEPWQRWNDYGIGLFRKGEKGSAKGELRQAEAAFAQVEKLGRPDGPLNRARVYIKEGRLDEAVVALQAAADHNPPAPAWSLGWFTGLVNKQNGNLDAAIENFTNLVHMRTAETQKREFDFSQDYTLLTELGETLFQRARGSDMRRAANDGQRDELLHQAVQNLDKALALDSENLSAHYNLAQIHAQLGDQKKADEHAALHLRYKPDDNAADRAIAIARMKDPAANHAAEAIVIYDLQRPGAFELPAAVASSQEIAFHD